MKASAQKKPQFGSGGRGSSQTPPPSLLSLAVLVWLEHLPTVGCGGHWLGARSSALFWEADTLQSHHVPERLGLLQEVEKAPLSSRASRVPCLWLGCRLYSAVALLGLALQDFKPFPPSPSREISTNPASLACSPWVAGC